LTLRRLGLALLGITLAGCSSQHPSNVVLIVIDTLRSDHLSLSGYLRDTSPRLAALARDGTTFDRAYAHSSSTRPSVTTILTSRFVSSHGVATQGPDALAPEVPTLAEMLHGAGFRTLAVVTNPQIHPRLGFARGFDVFDPVFAADLDPSQLNAADLVTRPADEVLARARAEIERLPTGAPFFAYVHLLDPHAPYAPPPAWRARFTDPGYHGPVTGTLFDFLARETIKTDPATLAQLEGLYDAEIAFTDDAIGGFVDWLRASGRARSTLVVVTADHGEEFLEHGDLGHGLTLFEEAVRVPLLLLGPGVPAGRRSNALVGVIDVAPTILDLLSVPPPATGLQGRSLRTAWRRFGAEERDALFLEGCAVGAVERAGRPVPRVTRAVVDDRHKILSRDDVRGDPAWSELEVFDLRADPKEQTGRRIVAGTPLDNEDRALVARYESEVARALALPGPASVPSVTLPPEDLKRLRSLGYLAR
jgi:arylsulfatase A-like enzyme